MTAKLNRQHKLVGVISPLAQSAAYVFRARIDCLRRTGYDPSKWGGVAGRIEGAQLRSGRSLRGRVGVARV